MRLLEQTLSDVGHYLLVLSDLCWDAYESTELGWEIDVLSLLADLEERLAH